MSTHSEREGESKFETSAEARIERSAADWLIARDRGLTPAKQAEFCAWLAAEPRHAELFAEMEETWNHLGELSDQLEAPVPDRMRPARIARIWTGGLFAAAAAIALLVIASKRGELAPVGDYQQQVATAVGTTQKLVLPDGSTVQLNTDTAVAVRYSSSERRVELGRGEAFFQVAKNPQRPFVVTAHGVAVRAVGTGFDVRLRPASVEVLVTEGKVRVSDAGRGNSLLPNAGVGSEPPVLSAGEKVVVAMTKAGWAPISLATAVTSPAIEQALSWEEGRLEFVSVPLAEIVDEFNRYNQHQLVIADASLAARRFGGTFGIHDYEAFVHVLESEFGVVSERDATQTRLRPAP